MDCRIEKSLGRFLKAFGLLVPGVWLISGCHLQRAPGLAYGTDPYSTSETRTIDGIDLEAISETPPLPIQEAVEQNRFDSIENATMEIRRPITLEEVRSAALSNNLDLRVERMSPEIARETYNAEAAKFDQLLAASIDRSEVDSPTGLKTSSVLSSVGLFKPMPSGGEMGVEFFSQRYNTNDPFVSPDPAYDNDLKFSISQPLLRGAGFQTNTHSIRVAKLQSGIEAARAKLEAIRILAAADKAYWAVYGASMEIEIRRQQYELAIRQLHDAKRYVASTKGATVEITRAESGLPGRLEGIINAVTNFRIRERNLKRIMNRPSLDWNSRESILPLTEPNPVGLSFDGRSLADFAVENRMEMLALEIQLAIDESQIEFDQNARLPLFTMDYEYNVNGLGRHYGDANYQIGDGDYADWSIGFQAEVPIGFRASNARLRQSILTRVQRLATQDQRRQAIEQEVYDALDLLDQNWQRILAARQEVVLAARTYEAERKLFQMGAEGRTSTDVLDAAARLALAQLREISALVDYQIAQVDIAFATGTLLGYSEVDWRSEDN
ncbi:MAG: TolC family protein [Candidatus Omnitrophica bacterium]|nr:TolC family protein [Candidatus Omnitrophota bacterium]